MPRPRSGKRKSTKKRRATTSSQASLAPLPTTVPQINDQIQKLEVQRALHVSAGSYLEAGKADSLIAQLQKRKSRLEETVISQSQHSERQGLSNAEFKKHEDHKAKWVQKMRSEERIFSRQEHELTSKHEDDLFKFDKDAEDIILENRVPYSKELLNLRKIEETMVRKRRFEDAHNIKLQADALAIQEEQTAHRKLQQSIDQRKSQLKNKQRHEHEALRRRQFRKRGELEKQQAQELEQLQRHFHTLKHQVVMAFASQKRNERLYGHGQGATSELRTSQRRPWSSQLPPLGSPPRGSAASAPSHRM
eukprot:TRINITY_DN2071_c0_g1_i1.p1 TRINITY_DN2071_c0_g1~~TRINITY_DN2071_c0_g1_i1.p1  ORF type:complete len:306 (+),score=52.25 TRINITY_DN2071_c0_g1_i1:44-961(+)